MIKKLEVEIQHIIAELEVLKAERVALERVGCVYGDFSAGVPSVSYKDGRYMVLVFPTWEGKRRRVYVGSDIRVQRQVFASIRRRQRHLEICRKIADLESRLRYADCMVFRIYTLVRNGGELVTE